MEAWKSSPMFLALWSLVGHFITALVSACRDPISCKIILRAKLGEEMKVLDTELVMSFSRV